MQRNDANSGVQTQSQHLYQPQVISYPKPVPQMTKNEVINQIFFKLA